jgi:hypothetical protein
MTQNDDDKKPGYAIGYGKPPKETQFKPGQSGNPGGRPRGAQNLSTLVASRLKAISTVTDQGMRKKVSRKEILAMHIVDKGAVGDQRFTPILLDQINREEARQNRAENKSHIPPITPETATEEVERIYWEALKNAQPAE